MNILSLDFGSSSLKAAMVKNGRIASPIARADYPTRYDGVRAEIHPKAILKALAQAIADLGPAARKAETIALTVMAPSWLAMDPKGKALTPIVTHQDRRSSEIAVELEARVGKKKHLKIVGTRPFPGGISSTTWSWFLRHEAAIMKKADLCGHLNTFLHRTLTNSRVTDPSNASFMGFYNTMNLSGWNDELIEAIGIKTHRLPQVIGSEEIGGFINRSAASRFGLTQGTPMLAGCMEVSAAVILAGNTPGQLVNLCGSTDVLALVTDKPQPHENLLTRPVGVGKRWFSVATLAAASTGLAWAHNTLFPDLSAEQFAKLVAAQSKGKLAPSPLHFDNFLAGSRTMMAQPTAAFTGLTLSTTREQLLAAIIESLAESSARRLALLKEVNKVRIRPNVLLTGDATQTLARLLHRDWPGQWTFLTAPEASLLGSAAMVTEGRA